MASRYAPANELIERMRSDFAEIAKAVAELGDQVSAEQDALQHQQDECAEARSDAERLASELTEWRELLTDFKLGIRDRDELLERTVGK